MSIDAIRNRHFLLCDAVLLAATPSIAYAIRFEGFAWNAFDAHTATLYTAIAMPLKLLLFVQLGLYHRLWRHASVADMAGILFATMVVGVACAFLGIVILPTTGLTILRVPVSVVALDGFLTLAAVAAPRLALKAFRTPARRPEARAKRVLIAGAGAAGELILKELVTNPDLGLHPVGFADDDPGKQGHMLGGKPVLGRLDEIPRILGRKAIDEVVIAMPKAPGRVVRSVVHAAREAGVPTRTVPGLFEIVSGRVRVSTLRKVEIQDLLRREPIHTDVAAVRDTVADRSVLITGAGGSIGSELARQIAHLGPARLLLLGNVENEIFEILAELRDVHPRLALHPIIADIRDLHRLHALFRRHRPQVVFHAAAHKHVPLMEANVSEAVTNNVLGTANLVSCAVTWSVQRLVLISTDKAVRPVSVMGATKRVAEIVVQRAAHEYGRQLLSVRFGNVLGSRGSVIPTFMRQIRAGGPVTITHPEMRRYFMTIPEAVQLVLQAGALGAGGEIFALDMGEPVRIVDLAADLIRLSGLEVGRDIDIRYTGVRPGERLNEEVFFADEDVAPTGHPKILRAMADHIPPDVDRHIEALVAAARRPRPDDDVRRLLHRVVPAFRPAADSAAAHGAAGHRAAVTGTVGNRTDRDRRVAERRSGHDRLSAVLRVGGDRRSGRDRRSGIDRRQAPDAAVPLRAASGG